MIKESNLIKLPILKKNFQPIDYQIRNVIYCLKDFYILGLFIERINSIKDVKVLPFKNIKDITEEGILINSMEDTVGIDEIPKIAEALKSYQPIVGYEIYSNNDEIIGSVKDTLLQIKSGKILGFIMSEGLFDDLINGYSFLPLVKDIDFKQYKIMLKKNEEFKILPQQGGLKKILGIDRLN